MLASTAYALEDEIPLPPGYSYPRPPTVEIPDPFFDEPNQFPSCTDEDSQLKFYYKDYVGFRRNLDTYAPYTVTWELLTFEHGFKQPWLGPQFAARLYQQSADEVRFVTRERLVVFRKATDADGKVSLKCISEDDWSIRREGDRVIVQSPKRWFAFDTPDYGQSWRLVETCFVGIPVPVKLHYDGPIDSLPSSLEYPDGKIAIIEPAEGLEAIGKLTLPNGMEYHIEYAPNGFPRILEEYALSRESPRKQLNGFTIESHNGKVTQTVDYKDEPKAHLELTRRWIWENDSEGRIRHMLAPHGSEISVEFMSNADKDGTTTVSIARDLLTGSYNYMKFHERDDIWTTIRGTGASSQPIDQATVTIHTVHQNSHGNMRLLKQYFANGTYIENHFGHNGGITERSVYSADGKLIVRLPFEKIMSQITKSRAQAKTNLPVYKYDDRGFLSSMATHDKYFKVNCDQLGRICRIASGTWFIAYRFNDHNCIRTAQGNSPCPYAIDNSVPEYKDTMQIDDIDRSLLSTTYPGFIARPTAQTLQSQEHTFTASFTYTSTDQIKTIELPSEKRVMFSYQDSSLRSITFSDNQGLVIYRFDTNGKLRALYCSQPGSQVPITKPEKAIVYHRDHTSLHAQISAGNLRRRVFTPVHQLSTKETSE